MQRSGAQACRAIPAICASVPDIAYRVVVLFIYFIYLFIYHFLILHVGVHCTSGPWTQPAASWGRELPPQFATTSLISYHVLVSIFICFNIICLLHSGAHCTSGRAQPAASWGPAENFSPRTGNLRRRPRYRISCVGVNVYLFFCLLIYFIVYCLLRSCMPQAVWVWAHSGCQWHISESGPRTQATPAMCRGIMVPDIAYRHGVFVFFVVVIYFLFYYSLGDNRPQLHNCMSCVSCGCEYPSRGRGAQIAGYASAQYLFN
jgi:hypothetical protein